MEANKSTVALEQPPQQEKKKSRRGLGSRKKAAEKYRTHKNETVGAKFIADRIAKFQLDNGLTPECLFGAMVEAIPIIKPEQEIFISTHELAEVAKQTVETLVSACKVPTGDLQKDIETVQLTASLQLEAKLHYARVESSFAQVDPVEDSLAERVVRNASQAILPVAAFIDQVGQFEVDGQKFIPGEEVDDEGQLKSFNYKQLKHQNLYNRDKYRFLSDQFVTIDNAVYNVRGRIYDTGRLFGDFHICVDVMNEAQASELGYIDASGNVNPNIGVSVFPTPPIAECVLLHYGMVLPTPDEIFQRYHEFIGRVQKKVTRDKLLNLHLERAVGTSAQLCYAGRFNHGFRDVWCAREVSGESLFISAAFELNVIQQPLTDELVSLVRTSVDSKNAISRMMRTLSERVER